MSRASYLREGARLPYCKGCGHGIVLRALDRALVSQALPADRIAIVTDIGCVGLADESFEGPHTIHTTHGRSTAFASGIALAEAALGRSGLKTVVLVGDGGATIGLQHLLHTASLNPDVTVIVHDNFLYGMTGGQGSAYSPLGFVTATTREGNAVPPLDLAGLVLAAGAPFVARKTAADSDLEETLARAVAHPGYAVVEVLELCTAYGVRWNALTGRALREMAAKAGWTLGILRDATRPTFAPGTTDDDPPGPPREADANLLAPTLARPAGIVLAGTAGDHVQTAATLLARAAIRCGLHATQRNDNPVTQGSGFSVSEIVLSPDPILHTGIERPLAVAVVSDDGARELIRSGTFDRIGSRTRVFADATVALPPLPATVRRLPFRSEAGGRSAALAAVFALVAEEGLVPREALLAETRARFGPDAEKTIESASRPLLAPPEAAP